MDIKEEMKCSMRRTLPRAYKSALFSNVRTARPPEGESDGGLCVLRLVHDEACHAVLLWVIPAFKGSRTYPCASQLCMLYDGPSAAQFLPALHPSEPVTRTAVTHRVLQGCPRPGRSGGR